MRNKGCWFVPAWRESGQFWTPRYLTGVFKGILLHPMSAESVSTSLQRNEALTAIAFVLSVFNMSLLLFIHDKTSSWMPDWTERNSSGGANLWKSFVSSAHLWKFHSWSEITSDRGREYSVNTVKTGPRTEPWGTPYTRGLVKDAMPSTITDWLRSRT